MTSQQSVGNAFWGGSDNEKKKTSFLNFENTFGQFTFTVPVETNKSFVPTLYMGPSNTLGLSFASKFNGKNMKNVSRPPLDLVLTIDKSGSMSSSFTNDGPSRINVGARGSFRNSLSARSSARSSRGPARSFSKMAVAKRCVNAIIDQLRDTDRLSIVLFTHRQEVLVPLTVVAKLKNVKKVIAEITANGGTSLMLACEKAFRFCTSQRKSQTPVPPVPTQCGFVVSCF